MTSPPNRAAHSEPNLWPRSARMIPIMLYDEFLATEELSGLLNYCLRNASRFGRSEVKRYDGRSELDNEYRRSRVLFDLGPYQFLFQQRLLMLLPHLLLALTKRPFVVRELEIQLTASNHGEFFRTHTDNDDKELKAREMTFVYYFHREPRRFAGGELRIFDTVLANSVATETERFQVIYPLQNQIVVFPSCYLHEVLPVICPSREFADSRFTVNGWYRR